MKKILIIVILITILVPSMLGYVKKSKETQARAEERRAQIEAEYEEFDD